MIQQQLLPLPKPPKQFINFTSHLHLFHTMFYNSNVLQFKFQRSVFLVDKIKTEILSPAGDFSALQAAVRFGADAVYMGGDIFTMRAAADNSREELKKSSEYAHKNGVKLYITLNTLPHVEELPMLPDYLRFLSDIGVDAVIVADLGVLSLCKKHIPNMEIHMSTQTGVVNYESANMLYELGAKRVVLARELTLKEIAEIRAKTPPELEIETFVHGSMCVSFSGRCLLSQYLLGRDANRGECAQPCRWGYHLMEEKREGLYFPIFEDKNGTYILNSKDLCMIEHLEKLAAAGVTSFKIEGRAKSDYYVGAVTNAYRLAVDGLGKEFDHRLYDELLKVSHREYYTGFYFDEKPENSQCYKSGGYVRTYDVVGIVTGSDDNYIYLTQKNKFDKGDEIDFLIPREVSFTQKIEEIYNEEGEIIETANHAEMKLKIPAFRELPIGTYLRKMRKQ